MEGIEAQNVRGELSPDAGGKLPEDTAEYMLFWFGDGSVAETTVAQKPRAKLDQLRKHALQLSQSLTDDYIWQRDAFDLRLVSRKGVFVQLLSFILVFFFKIPFVNPNNRKKCRLTRAVQGLLYLYGQTSYGDCVEDEWLIVYMLRELTKSFQCAWARICDNDGEFLLIEGATAVPTWITPETDVNRVWMHNGMLKIIPLEAIKAAGIGPVSTEAPLTLADAVHIIKEHPESLVRLQSLEDEVFHRLQKYPGHVTSAIHYSRLILPRKIAYILHSRPRAAAPAVEAFTSRDPLTAKRIVDSARTEKSLQFPPSDLVVISVKFTRVLYAQLRGQRFTPPNTWPVLFASRAAALLQSGELKFTDGEEAVLGEKLEVMVELSMKLTFGFELMALSAEMSNSRVVREVGLILEDIAEDGDDPAALPSDDEIRTWPDASRESDDTWLNINFEDFERELDGLHQSRDQSQQTCGTSRGSSEVKSRPGFGDLNMQTDLRRIVSQFQTFLNDTDAGIDGADLGEMDRDDDDDNSDDNSDEDDGNVRENEDSESSENDGEGVKFNKEDFARLLRETMGLPQHDDLKKGAREQQANKELEVGAGTLPRSPKQEIKNGLDEDEEGILKLAAQFEAELRGHGALRINPPRSSKKHESLSLQDVVSGRDARDNAPSSSLESDDEEDLDVDFNLVKNLLESFKGQEGMSGPAGNILGMLGLSLPRDEDGGNEAK